MHNQAHTESSKINPCVFGHGIRCGLSVQVEEDCSITVSAGAAILASGAVIQVPEKHFRYYYTQSPEETKIRDCIGFTVFYELVEDEVAFDPDSMDDLKQQHPEDIPEEDFFIDKAVAMLFLKDEAQPYFLLLGKAELASYLGIPATTTEKKSPAIFPSSATKNKVKEEDVTQFFSPEVRLPRLRLPRFGYQQLALISNAEGLRESNLQNPFTAVNAYADIFFEYKTIIDKYIFRVQDALDILHEYFGPQLSHKGQDYLKKYGEILVKKWQRFCEEGEHLFYVQYFYDWLCDLISAYDELRTNLSGFDTACTCIRDTESCGELLLLGPLLGGNTTYRKVPFRDVYASPVPEADIQEVRILHWRLLMMIWTFDLPFLGLEQVLYAYGFDPGVEEELDSTNYWEWVDENGDQTVDFEDLPIKATPSGFPNHPLGEHAIPYYYPLDSNSIYSLHRFWSYQKTRMQRQRSHFSYNAHFDNPDLPSTDVVNDSYSDHPDVILPLAFCLKSFEYYRIEGYIGKKITIEETDGVGGFYFTDYEILEGEVSKRSSLKAYLFKYNLNIDIIAAEASALPLLLGVDRRPSIQQGQTLVLVYIDDEEGEQIELKECKKDVLPEVKPHMVLADFWLPFKYSCCELAAEDTASIYQLIDQPEATADDM